MQNIGTVVFLSIILRILYNHSKNFPTVPFVFYIKIVSKKSIFQGLSFSVILLCLYFIHHKMKGVTYSKVYEAVQKQLYRALLSQMIVPLILIYIPILIVMILPIFNVKNDASTSLTSILISIYPVLDPFAVIMIISVYRQGFFNMFRNKPVNNQVANLDMSL